MANLYRVKVLHGAPKGSHESIEAYLIANDDEAVFRWLDEKTLGRWTDDDEETRSDWGINRGHPDYNKEFTMKELVIRNRGDMADENGWEDAYYGVTKYGWELVAEISEHQAQVLYDLGIVEP